MEKFATVKISHLRTKHQLEVTADAEPVKDGAEDSQSHKHLWSSSICTLWVQHSDDYYILIIIN